MKFSKYYLKLLTLTIASVIVDSQTTTPTPATDETPILWSLAPCQSAFWIPSTSSDFTQNWITYQFEGNPVSQLGECIFTLESDPNTRIEMIVQEVNLFGSGVTTPPPCLNLYNVQANGTIVLLKTECNTVLSTNMLESNSTFTDINLAVISTTIRYGSFQLQARAVPQSSTTPPRVSTTTPMSPTNGTTSTPTNTTTTSTTTSTTSETTTTTQAPTTVTTPNTTSSTNSTNSFRISSQSISKLPASVVVPPRKIGQPRIIVKMVSELNEKRQQLP